MIVGTTNQDEFLNDPTGNRRFWIVPVNGNLDLEKLRAERDRFWAAAVELYQRGVPWWLSPAEAFQSEQIAKEFQNRDPWHEAVERYVECVTEGRVTTSEILTNGIKLELGRQTRGEQMRVADILRSLGWEQKTQVYRGKRQRVWAAPAIAQHPESQPSQPTSEVVTEVVSIENLTGLDFEGDRHNHHNLFSLKTDLDADSITPQTPVVDLLEVHEDQIPLKSFAQKGCDGCDDRLEPVYSSSISVTTDRHNLSGGRAGCDGVDEVVTVGIKVGDRAHYQGTEYKQICRDKELEVVDIQGDIATVTHRGWVKHKEVPVADLVRSRGARCSADTARVAHA